MSPLKALATDIQQNLEAPLREIAAAAGRLGLTAPAISVAVRTGDTAAAERAAMLKHPPDILITTPESLYLLLTAERSRAMLRSARTVIVDEIHAVAGNKRGSHLTLTLERLAHVAGQPVQRVGLSATQRPIEAVARLLVGAGPDRDNADGSPRCAIVDSGHRRRLDLALELPDDELGAVPTTEQTAQILDMIAGHVTSHRTTLVFVNTRSMAERVAHQLGERLGDEVGAQVAAHHGSLSRGRRQRVEARLRAGDLRALVATASLELGIDVGPVELVCQIGSPRSFATFLQRVGRSNHTRTGTPSGRLYPTTRDELVECAALLRGTRQGRLDAIVVPERPLDILAQQMVAESAAESWAEGELLSLARQAAPFRDLSAEDFEDITDLLAEGIRTGRGRRAYYLHRDQVNGTVKGRRGARLAALTSGGAIPELGDFRVVAEPDEVQIGTVHEEWAVESRPGDVFLLGTHSWRIRRVEPGTVRVTDAHGAPPSVPHWQGEAPGRTRELSEEVSALRQAVADREPAEARKWLEEECGVGRAAAETIVAYLRAGLAALGALPTMDAIILERFFDEAGGMQLVGHAPFGARVNRAFGLALRKRFCVTFDFELQAAASDNAILLSLGPQHSFPLEQVPKFLASKTVEQVVRQAVLTAPLFQARWRWNLNTSLTILRMRGGRKNPPAIQRMEADDLMAAVFPVLAACQENVAPGPMEIPDHPLVRQTLEDCLHEAMDIDGLRELVAGIEAGRIAVITRDTTEPSVLAHEILNGPPFTYLDDETEAGNRRSRQVTVPRGLPVEARDLARLDPDAIEKVREQIRPLPRDADELHDLLMTLYLMRPQPEWAGWFAELAAAGRAAGLPAGLWCATERVPVLADLCPAARTFAMAPLPQVKPMDTPAETVAAEMLRGHLDVSGPVTAEELARATSLGVADVNLALIRLENEGFALRGRFTDPDGVARAVVRPAGADPHPRVHQAAQAARGRAGHGPRLHPVPAALAARHRRHPAGGQPRRAGRGGAAAGLRAGRRGLGEGRLPGPGDRIPTGVAGRGMPGRRRRLGPALGPRRCGRAAPAGRRPVPGHPGHPDHPRRPAVAAAGGPRRAPPRRTGTGQHQRRPGRAPAARRAVPARPGIADRQAAVRGGGGAVGRGGPRSGHRGRLPRRPDAVRPARDAERARPAPAAARQPAQLADGRPVVAAARAAGRLRPGRPGRGGRRAARGPLGRGVPRPAGPGEPGRAVARGAVGATPDGGPRHDLRRPVRARVQRRAVRAPRRGGHAARDQEAAADRGDRRAVRRRPAEPGRDRAARPAHPGGGHEHRDIRRRRPGNPGRRRFRSGSPLSWHSPRGAAASSPGGRSGRCTRSGNAAGSPGARARPPRTGRPRSPR